MKVEFTTPVGRLVQGDCFTGQANDSKGQPYIIKTGPNAGKPTVRFFFAVAFPKVLANGMPNEEFNQFYRTVIDTARAGYPQFFNGPIDAFTGKPSCTHPRMTFKIADGDGNDANGKDNKTKPGFTGHWVVKFGGTFAPKCFNFGKFEPAQQLLESSLVKNGYYVSVSGDIEPNIGSDVPGVYMNGKLVCVVARCPDAETAQFQAGPDASAAFKNIPMGSMPAGVVPGANPANAVPTPAGVVPSVPVVPNVPSVPVAHDPLAVAVANGWVVHPTSPGYFYKGQEVKTNVEVAALFPAPSVPQVPMVPAVPSVPSVPNVPSVPVLPATPAGPMLTPAGAALGTYESFRTNGWTDDMMRQHGYMV